MHKDNRALIDSICTFPPTYVTTYFWLKISGQPISELFFSILPTLRIFISDLSFLFRSYECPEHETWMTQIFNNLVSDSENSDSVLEIHKYKYFLSLYQIFLWVVILEFVCEHIFRHLVLNVTNIIIF